jgi:nicotinamidase-related amidase
MRAWQTIFPEADRQVFQDAFGVRQEPGRRPALLIVDVVLSFVGSRPMPVLEAIKEWRTSCGEAAWAALPQIRRVLEAAREAKAPVVYTTGHPDFKAFCGGSTKASKRDERRRPGSEEIPAIIAPRDGEFVLPKTKASAFFGSPLATYLNSAGVDSLLVCGCTTSGCVRATVVDGFSHGYRVFVAEEACFDRSQFSHLVSLFEMNSKYADVITVDEGVALLAAHAPARARSSERGGGA